LDIQTTVNSSGFPISSNAVKVAIDAILALINAVDDKEFVYVIKDFDGNVVFSIDGFGNISYANKSAAVSTIIVDAALSGTSENPIQNKAVFSALGEKLSSSSVVNGVISGNTSPVTSGAVKSAIEEASIAAAAVTIVTGLAEIWVASSDAPTAIKSVCQFVCDGTADEVQINLAIQSISEARGGTVKLTAGRFFLDTPVIIDRQVHLLGSGRGIKLSLDNVSTAVDTRGTALLQTTNTDVIKIQTANKLQGFQIENMLLVGYGRQNNPIGHGINIAGGSDVSVMRNLSISDCYAGIFYNHLVTSQMLDTPWIDQCSIQRNHVGILIIDGHLMRITNNIFWENYGIGTYGTYAFNCGGIAIQGLGDHLITNNHFGESNFIEGSNVAKDSSHISLIGAEVTILGNQFNKTSGNAIKITGYTSYSKISNNRFKHFGNATALTDAQRAAFYIYHANTCEIMNNYIHGNGAKHAIYEDDWNLRMLYAENTHVNLTATEANKTRVVSGDTIERNTVIRNF